MAEIGFPDLEHETLPDVVAYFPEKDWLLLIEAVHSSNPVDQLRHLNLERIAKGCKGGPVYVSVFRNRESFRNWVIDLSWETEVWLVDEPSHMIHFNGDKFLGPY